MSRRRTALRVIASLAIVAAAACSSGENSNRAWEGASVQEIGAQVASFPSPDGAVILEDASTLHARDGVLWVPDRMAGTVLRFSLDGSYLGGIGSSGVGPGELSGPTVVAIGPDSSVWVGDGRTLSLSRFSTDGTFIERRPVNSPAASGSFVVLSGIGPIAVSADPARVLEVFGVDVTGIANAPGLPPELTSFDRRRLGYRASLAVPLPGSRVALLDNVELRLWTLDIDADGSSLARARRVEIPADVIADVERERGVLLESLNLPAGKVGTINGFKSMHALYGGKSVWLAPMSSHIVGIEIPLSPGGRSRVIVSDGDNPVSSARDLLLLGDRLYALWATEIRVFQVTNVRDAE